MKYYAVGFPIGRLNEKDEYYFMREGQMFNVNAVAFKVWSSFLHGAEVTKALALEPLQQIIGREQAEILFQQLADVEMLVPEKEILAHVAQRQGYGVGYSAQTGKCTVYLNGKIEISYPAYLLWAYCDGKTAFRDLMTRMPLSADQRYTEEALLRAVDELLRDDLIVFAE